METRGEGEGGDRVIAVTGKANGREYYALQGQSINLPEAGNLRPNHELLAWHNEHIYRE
jgi:hypothetical protein